MEIVLRQAELNVKRDKFIRRVLVKLSLEDVEWIRSDIKLLTNQI